MKCPAWMSLETPLSGRTYAMVGIAGFAIKFAIDRWIARHIFQEPWTLMNYWRGINPVYLFDTSVVFYKSMLTLALPFILFGIWMTLRRLQTIHWPLWLSGLFFIPVANIPFFLTLVVHRDPTDPPGQTIGFPIPAALVRRLPRSLLGNALLTLTVTGMISFAFIGFDLTVLKKYGWSLFVFLPFFVGAFSAYFYSITQQRTLLDCFMISALSSGVLAALLLCFAMEGVICIIMAAPIWLCVAFIGAWAGYVAQAAQWRHLSKHQILLVLVLSAPLIMGAEYAAQREAPLLKVTSAMIIRATPECVWKNVVSFSELPSPTEWIFSTGLAYPIRARIAGTGVGAIRRCEFSTGAFIEPIKIWDEPRHLQFAVTDNPPPMREMSPYAQIDPPHLHGFLVSRQGEFRLTALPDGTTRLEGTTWYQHHLWPAAYWQLWSDYIIHQIHMRVLKHIQRLSETQ